VSKPVLQSKALMPAALVLIAIIAVAIFAWTQRSSLKLEAVRVGIPTAKVRASYKTFSYNELGHFANKTQFESCKQDALGGSYSLHCRDGKVYAVEVNYPNGADRAKVMDVVAKISGHEMQTNDEHDDKELSLKDCDKPSEYFYFDKGKTGVELDFARDNKQQVNRVYCWST